jgi:hypothetical protein
LEFIIGLNVGRAVEKGVFVEFVSLCIVGTNVGASVGVFVDVGGFTSSLLGDDVGMIGKDVGAEVPFC